MGRPTAWVGRPVLSCLRWTSASYQFSVGKTRARFEIDCQVRILQQAIKLSS